MARYWAGLCSPFSSHARNATVACWAALVVAVVVAAAEIAAVAAAAAIVEGVVALVWRGVHVLFDLSQDDDRPANLPWTMKEEMLMRSLPWSLLVAGCVAC